MANKTDGDVLDRPKTKTVTPTKTKNTTKRPPLYKVILLNDDYTPFDLVVIICAQVFKIDGNKAMQIMLTAHQRGSCLIACYAKDIAETKAAQAMDLARGEGYPLALAVEPDGDSKGEDQE